MQEAEGGWGEAVSCFIMDPHPARGEAAGRGGAFLFYPDSPLEIAWAFRPSDFKGKVPEISSKFLGIRYAEILSDFSFEKSR